MPIQPRDSSARDVPASFGTPRSTPKSLIVADGLTKTYTTGSVSVEALKDLTFTIDRASFVSFVGPSGSGKTTLLNLIGALDRPTTGRLLVSDTDIGMLDRRAAAAFRGRTVGFIFQEFNLIPVLTAYENVEYPLLLVQHLAAAERRQRVLTLLDTGYASADWTGDARAYEAYVSLKPAPSLTVDAGKKTLKWGKGYLWNPAAFLDRVKSPEDPALALEGFTVLSADYIRTFGGPLQVLSVTPVLLPAYGNLNESFGERGHFNVAGKLYVLLYDTDVDVMVLSGGSRPGRVGFDVSRNVRSNLELHGEWTRIAHAVTPVLSPAGTLSPTEGLATNLVLGIRYLTESNTTFIADYYRNGAGYASAEMETYFDLIERGYESFSIGGDDRLLALARRASEAGYGRMNPMRNYVYGRVNQPDALGALYLTLGASAIVNADDGSYSLLPEVQYKPTENLELRWLANIQRGGLRTEFGDKQADVRFEFRARYYF